MGKESNNAGNVGLVIVGGILLILLAALAMMPESEFPFLRALNRVVSTLLERLWGLLLQPITLIVAGVFFLVRFGSSYLKPVGMFLDEMTASVGPVSAKGRLGIARLLSEGAVGGGTVREGMDKDQGAIQEEVVKEIVGRFDIDVVRFLVAVANRKIEVGDLARIAGDMLGREGTKVKGKYAETLSAGLSAGVARSYRGILLDTRIEDVDKEHFEVEYIVRRAVLRLLQERVQEEDLMESPA